jgi:hypothetical protein
VKLNCVALVGCVVVALFGCKPKPQRFTTTVEVLQVRSFGGGTGPKNTDLEVKYSECPADARQNMRLGKEFATCGEKLKAGDKLKADVVLSWNGERGVFRNEVVKLAACDVKLDPKDEANYQSVEACSEVKATGMTVGVRCNRGRSPELLEKCPWLRRD